MACPTCDHTMANLHHCQDSGNVSIFLCQRCGTVKYQNNLNGSEELHVPDLVKRARELLDNLASVDYGSSWFTQAKIDNLREAVKGG